MKAAEVLMVGAGPTGLVLALWLTRLGVAVRIVDKQSRSRQRRRARWRCRRARWSSTGNSVWPTPWSRAGARCRGQHVGQRPAPGPRAFGESGRGVSPLSFLQIFPQDEHERLLIEQLRAARRRGRAADASC